MWSKMNADGGKMGNRKLHLINMEKVKDGRFIKNFKLTFLNTSGRKKEYEMISFNELEKPDDIDWKNKQWCGHYWLLQRQIAVAA